MATYEIHVTGSDPVGFNFLDNVVEMASKGAKIKEGQMPFLKFPHRCTMVLEAEEAPTPTAFIRVFHEDTKKEVYAKKIEAVKVEQPDGTFSVEIDPAVATNDKGEPWTKEQLDAMSWDELKLVVKAATGQSGRDRQKLTREYLAKTKTAESTKE